VTVGQIAEQCNRPRTETRLYTDRACFRKVEASANSNADTTQQYDKEAQSRVVNFPEI